MRVLIVNPNTSEGATQRIDAAAQAVARDEDIFTTVSAAFGPKLIVTEQDGLDAVAGVLASVQAHESALDGIVLASFGDTGAAAVREAYPDIPVIGIAGAAFAAARCLGGQFSIVTFDESLAPALRDRALFYGMQDNLHRVVAVPHVGAFDAATVQVDRFDAIQQLCVDCAKDPITSIIIGGGPAAGLARRINPKRKIAMIDGTQSAIGLLRGAVNS